jgi:hypothetical protein
MRPAGLAVEVQHDGEVLSQGMWSVVVFVFCPNNGRDYDRARRFGQPACRFSNRRLDGKSLGISCTP